MKAFLDTSVFVAGFSTEHPYYEASIALIESVAGDGLYSGHSLLETYSVLTRLPGVRRAEPTDALLYIGSLRERLTGVTLTEQECYDLIDSSVRHRIAGGRVYDAQIAACAAKAGADILYTWDLGDFRPLGAMYGIRVEAPPHLAPEE